jgi:desulfoferrodoxin (superoxide reductase-like protein)
VAVEVVEVGHPLTPRHVLRGFHLLCAELEQALGGAVNVVDVDAELEAAAAVTFAERESRVAALVSCVDDPAAFLPLVRSLEADASS